MWWVFHTTVKYFVIFPILWRRLHTDLAALLNWINIFILQPNRYSHSLHLLRKRLYIFLWRKKSKWLLISIVCRERIPSLFFCLIWYPSTINNSPDTKTVSSTNIYVICYIYPYLNKIFQYSHSRWAYNIALSTCALLKWDLGDCSIPCQALKLHLFSVLNSRVLL